MREIRPGRFQFQLLELLKVADRQYGIGLNARVLGKDAILMRSAGLVGITYIQIRHPASKI